MDFGTFQTYTLRSKKKNQPTSKQSPIVRQLHPDVTVTSIIFEFCLPDVTNHQLSPNTEEDLSIPLFLGAICSYFCSYWRDVASSTPSLWSSLVVRVTGKRDSLMTTGIVREWLSRSGQLPLSIRISLTSNGETRTVLHHKLEKISALAKTTSQCHQSTFYLLVRS